MSWLLIALGAVVSAATKPKPYKPSAIYLANKAAFEGKQTINLREILPTDYTTEEERLRAIKAWNDYYQEKDPYHSPPVLSTRMTIDGYNDVAVKLGIEWFRYYDDIK